MSVNRYVGGEKLQDNGGVHMGDAGVWISLGERRCGVGCMHRCMVESGELKAHGRNVQVGRSE